ncbi:ABC transporter ATP-binding protein [Bilifractor sp. LCP21S3_A7]|uniref:ABC transporter ATP-binding protein n=1 Tax=Bilifractor sp. LCP21S3_A7 TaxID=3438738 RepID=UPI003F9259F5
MTHKQILQDDHAGHPLTAHVASSKIMADGIDKIYIDGKKQTLALKQVSIDIKDNDFCCIVGPSGCGKSTLLRMLAGLDFPTKGKIIIDDREVTGPGPDRGMVFQTYTLFPWMSVEDNIKFGLKLKKMPKDQQQEIADRYLKIIGLQKFAKAYPKELSGGMKQRVAIARALANQPEVLLMDEPFGALDPHTKAMMQLLLREIWEQEHPTVVFITHDIDEAVFLANKIYVMSARPGRVIKDVDVRLPHTRELELKDTPEFIRIRKNINYLLYSSDEEAEE